MAIDPSIALQVRQPQFDNPLDNYAKASQVMAIQNRNKLFDVEMQDRERGLADDSALRGLYKSAVGADGKVDRNKLFSGLAQAGLGNKLPAMQKSYADMDKTQAAASKDKLSIAKDINSMIGSAAYAVSQNPTVENAQSILAGLKQQLGPEFAQQLAGVQLPTDPSQVAAWAQQHYVKATQVDKLIEDERKKSEGALNRGVTIRGQNLTDAREREKLQGSEIAFTPDAIDNAAARYNIDGTLPPMGMGKAGAQGRSAILNRAAVLAKESGVSGEDQRIAQIGNKANSAALSKIQQQKTMVGAFERNFVKNADIVLELSEKVDRTGVPIVNKWINAGKRSIAGDPDLTAFDAAIKAVANENAKIVSGSMGNTAVAEGEIKKIEGLLNAAQTPAQVKAVINLMKRETKNRMDGFDAEIKELRGSMSRKPAAKSSAVPDDISSLLNQYGGQ